VNYEKIHIDEERTWLLWALTSLVSIAAAAYFLFEVFAETHWLIVGYTAFICLILFAIASYGIVRITSPLYHFDLSVKDSTLQIEIRLKGDEPLDVQKIPLKSIRELRIAPHTPRSGNEALFDFATNYHLLYRSDQSGDFQRLIYLEEQSFTLKVQDIHKIIAFLTASNHDIVAPGDQLLFFSDT
jgi:hypothetical protein